MKVKRTRVTEILRMIPYLLEIKQKKTLNVLVTNKLQLELI